MECALSNRAVVSLSISFAVARGRVRSSASRMSYLAYTPRPSNPRPSLISNSRLDRGEDAQRGGGACELGRGTDVVG